MEQKDDAQRKTKNQIPSAVLNLVNSTIGAGVLSLPFVIANSGLALGLALIFIFGILANYTLRLLHEASFRVNKFSYESVVVETFNHWAAILLNISIIIINFGGLFYYLFIYVLLIICSYL